MKAIAHLIYAANFSSRDQELEEKSNIISHTGSDTTTMKEKKKLLCFYTTMSELKRVPLIYYPVLHTFTTNSAYN